ncbi:phosphate/phosphite/phosphonate ABC transporter substrate-binding protein [Chryseosolibacter indicus]|uniref:Phosphate/phosphite/phosphonate ABC transporter substrate-binding protein n=1 Tax=Chryseosolibacter indicus TaxID=2782351 RepID=A0ABS5VTZ7_9BACT|nr:phosphate/phosphite/phosphonate ABC transporter substrate-binding protein [Chryseosolibacter indicus]MBT1704315.1 phosphate/phosphite/phosphonate ABC transporter substrate-binding protein [Chryseosolibacter indicus]
MNKKILLSGLFIVFYIFAIAQVSNPINLYLTPSISDEALKESGSVIEQFLEKETGLPIDLKIPKTYEVLIENFGSDKRCFAFMSSQSYVVANGKYKASVKLRIVRFGHSVYQGMIVAHESSGIKTLRDLQGKTMAYTDELSTSGYLYPKMMLKKNKVTPSNEVYLQKHDEVIKQVYEKKVDAGAAFYSEAGNGSLRDARSRLKEKYPDVEKKVVIIAKTDPIPNDPLVFSKDFDAAHANKICMALIKLAKDEKGKQALLQLYGAEGFVKASDADYNTLRQVVKANK